MKSLLITGCNRGIGLGLVKHLVQQRGSLEYLFATYRDQDSSQELMKIASENKWIHLIQLDVRKFETFDHIVECVDNITKGFGLNVLINNAGISSKFTRVGLVKPEQMMETFRTNTVAPLILSKTFVPLLKKASTTNSDSPLGIQRAAIINVSSVLGSITNNEQGGFYPYRSSKAALNAVTKSLSVDLKDEGIVVTSLHPGWVKTDMGGANADLTVDTSVQAILNTLTILNEEHNGKFIQYDGTELPW